MTMLNKAMLAKRISDKPLMMDPNEREFVVALLEASDSLAADQAFFMSSDSDVMGGKPYRIEDGMAVIPVQGVLLHKFDAHYPGWFTGYAYIESLVDQAAADPMVRKIVLDVASHGGEVSGCFECVGAIRAASMSKPVLAVVDGYAHSAGYALASAADKITMSATASVGSVGVVTMHVDYSKQLAAAGISVTYIYAGAQKVDGNPYAPLADDVKDRIQARVEKSYEVFVASVADGRRLDPEVVRGTEAGTFAGNEALALGLVDAVMSPREAFAAIKGALSGSPVFNAPKGGSAMSATQQQEPVAQPQATAEVDVNAVKAEAVQAEKARISGIVGCEEASGRASLASHLAFKTEMSVEQAKALLAAAPKEAAASQAAGISALDAAMEAAGGTPGVGIDAAGSQAADEDPVARILGNYQRASGFKPSQH